MDSMDAQSNDESRLTNRAAGFSLTLSFSFSLYLSLREGSYLPQFDPRGVYDLPVQSAFFRRFLRGPREIYLVARTLLLLYTVHASRGVPSDASITGSELHPGSLRTGPTVYREVRRGREGGREVPAGISLRHLVGRGRDASRWYISCTAALLFKISFLHLVYLSCAASCTHT